MASKRSNPTKARESTDDMIIVRGDTKIKPPSKKEIQSMKNREFMRKHPHTSA